MSRAVSAFCVTFGLIISGLIIVYARPKTCFACDCMVATFNSVLTPNLEASEFPASITQDLALKKTFEQIVGTVRLYGEDTSIRSLEFADERSDDLLQIRLAGRD